MESMPLRKVWNALILASALGIAAALLAPGPVHAAGLQAAQGVSANLQ